MRTHLRSILLLVALASTASSFVSRKTPISSRSIRLAESKEEVVDVPPPITIGKVAVTGATGRTGSLVVQELLNRQVSVVAMVRNADRAKETFGDVEKNPLLKVIPCDLTNEEQVAEAVTGCDAAIWCATGFSDAQTSVMERVKRLLGIALRPKRSIDAVGVPLLAKAMLNQVVGRNAIQTPKVVMLSSAGVTRPSWDEEKKAKYRGCADIPIVRLNPFGILDVKAESEEGLRRSGKKM